MTDVRRLVAEEWELMKDVRLRALADAPENFGSNLAREAAFTEKDWRGRFVTSVSFVAMDGDKPVGLVGGVLYDGGWVLVAMWVAPEARGKRIAGLLIDAVVAHAAGQGAPAVSLEVFEGNSSALRAYERYGFAATENGKPGRVQMLYRVAN
jgi:ribosomal protein S18 acetylase RimI-like enzyme